MIGTKHSTLRSETPNIPGYREQKTTHYNDFYLQTVCHQEIGKADNLRGTTIPEFDEFVFLCMY